MIKIRIPDKVRFMMHLDKPVRFVWQAGPGMFLFSMISLCLESLLPLAALYLMKMIVDKIAWAVTAKDVSQAYYEVLVLVLWAGGVAWLMAMIQQVSRYIKERQTLIVTDKVYETLHEKSLAVDLEYYENPEYFDSLHRAQKQGPYRPARIVNGLTTVMRSSLSLLAVSGLLISFHWGLSLVLFAAAIPGLVVRLLHSKKLFAFESMKTRTERKADYYHRMLTDPDHAKEIRLFNLGFLFGQRFNDLRASIRNEKISLAGKRAWGDSLAQVFAVIAVFGSLGLIAFRCVQGVISLGDLVMYFQAFQRGLSLLKELFEGLAGLYEDNLFISHFYDFLDIQPRVKEAGVPLPFHEPTSPCLGFNHVSFRYPGSERMALKDISFNVHPGEVIALVGENGSGKSTLVKLLCRLYDPDQGLIHLNEQDLKAYKISDIRKSISVVFQDFVRYHMPVKENIWLGDAQSPLDMNRIKQSAAFADAAHFIDDLPHGYDTLLGKWMGKGEDLSLGQWQKIALARTFFRQARIVVLDEPTSSLDPDSEYQVFVTFRQLLENRTAFLISHRFSTVKMADRILVLSQGRLVESGTHQELMAEMGLYHRMYSRQAGNYI